MRRPARARGVLIPILVTGAMIAALLSLGVWQLERRADKLMLLAALDERLLAAPVAPPPAARWNDLSPRQDEFRRITFSAVVDAHNQAHVFASPSALRKDVSGPGSWAFAPARLAGGEMIVVNRGFVADGQDASQGTTSAPVELTGYIRFPEATGWLTPRADLARRLWFVRDHLEMAQALGWSSARRIAPFYIDLEGPVPAGGVPKPGPLQVSLKNDHLQYAITWFLLAGALSIAFGIWLRGSGRPASLSL